MEPPDQHRADHGPYAAAVRDCLESNDVEVTSLTATITADGLREAMLELRPDQDAFAEPVPARAMARWDEENGWSVRVSREALPGHEIREGLSVLPEPDDVAVWVVVALAHPELSLSREGPPLRQHRVADPDFEARLARYAAGM
jgi:hypothetical protein